VKGGGYDPALCLYFVFCFFPIIFIAYYLQYSTRILDKV